MVHALKAIWRVLVPDGMLIDLRPFHANWPVEIVDGESITPVGPVDDSLGITHDIAADNAMAAVVQEGWFTCEYQTNFDYAWYWDSSGEMKTHFENKSPPLILPQTLVHDTRRSLAAAGPHARVRIRINMLLARYRKTLHAS